MLAGAAGVVGCKVTPLQHKSQPCIPGEYVGLVVLDGGAAGIFGVALLSHTRRNYSLTQQ